MESKRESLLEIDEENQIYKRFQGENVDHLLTPEKKILVVWRWLVDAESNNESIKMYLENVQRHYLEDIEELKMMLKDSEIEIRRLNAELDDQNENNAEIVSEEINQMLIKQGLKDLSCCGVSEQFAFLLVERAQMKEELEAELEKQHRKNHTYRLASKLNLTDSLKLSSPQIQQLLEEQKNEFEAELRNQQLMVRQLKEELKVVHEKEIENMIKEKDLLQWQLNSASKKLEEFAHVLSERDKVGNKIEAKWLYNILNGGLERDYEKTKDERDNLLSKSKRQEEEISKFEADLKNARKSNRMLELDNQNLDFKLTEVLMQCTELEDAIQAERLKSRRASNLRSASIFESQSQVEALHGLFDRKISSAQQDLTLVDQVRRLKLEVSSLKNQIKVHGEKYEILARKYQISKGRHRERLQKMREIYFREKKNFDQKITLMNGELKLQDVRVKQEQSLQERIKEDIKILTAQNSGLKKRMMDLEVENQDKSQDLEVTKHQLQYLESENTGLLYKIGILQRETKLQSCLGKRDETS